MTDRLKGKSAIVLVRVPPGPRLGNGRLPPCFMRVRAPGRLWSTSQGGSRGNGAIIAAEGGQALAVAADVTSPASVEAGWRPHGSIRTISILHNNVGVTPYGRTGRVVGSTVPQSWISISVGVPHPKACHPAHIEAGRWRVVNNLVARRHRWTAILFAYYATKAAVTRRRSRSRLNMRPHGIRANCVVPADRPPLIYKQISSQYASARKWWQPATRRFRAGVWAMLGCRPCSAFLASDEANSLRRFVCRSMAPEPARSWGTLKHGRCGRQGHDRFANRRYVRPSSCRWSAQMDGMSLSAVVEQSGLNKPTAFPPPACPDRAGLLERTTAIGATCR